MRGEQRRDLGAQPRSARASLVEKGAPLFTVALKRSAKHGLHLFLLVRCQQASLLRNRRVSSVPGIISPWRRPSKRDQSGPLQKKGSVDFRDGYATIT